MEKNKYYRLEPKKIKTFGLPDLGLIKKSMNEVLKDIKRTEVCSKYKECLGIKTFLDKFNMNFTYPDVPIIVRYDGESYEEIITTIEINSCDLFELVELPNANFDNIEAYHLNEVEDYSFYFECIRLLVDIATIYQKVTEPFYEVKATNCYTIGFVSSKQSKNNQDIIGRISYFKEKMSINDKVFISSRGNLSCDCFDGLYNTVPIVVTVDGDKCYEYWTKTELPIDGIFQINAPISSEELNDLKPGVSNYTYVEAVREFATILSDYKKDYEQPVGNLGIARTRKSINQKNQGK